MKSNKGITLIALVITIIVLLILAGVSIAMLSGDNSILGRANQAGKETAVATAKEQIALAINEGMADYYHTVHVQGNTADLLTLVNTKLAAAVTEANKATNIQVAYSTQASASANGTITITYNGTLASTGTITAGTAALSWADEGASSVTPTPQG